MDSITQSWIDDEACLTFTTSGNVVDTFTYNGLGLRVGKTDSTGTYSYLCDGTTPGSPVLSDGHAVYTPGLSERRGGVSSYYDFDQAGNLWTVDGAGKSQLSYQDATGFGTVTAGTPAGTPYQFGGANGCQTDKDTGLVLMGYRYYDTRIGRFLSQDHAGAGMNWYAYADNNPINKTDPSGLSPSPSPDGMWSLNGGCSSDQASAMGRAEAMDQQADQFIGGLWAELAARNAMGAAKASSGTKSITLCTEWLIFPGSVENDSDYSIPIILDRFQGKQKINYLLLLPPHTYTDNEDVDYVWVSNDSNAPGGSDWRHILSLTTTYISDSGNGVEIDGFYRGGLFRGYPYGITPIPYPGNPRKDGIIKSIPDYTPLWMPWLNNRIKA